MPVYILVSSKWSQYKNQPYFDLHHGGMAGNEFSVRNTPDLRSYGGQLIFYETHRSSTKTCCMIHDSCAPVSALVSFPDYKLPHKYSLGTRSS